MRPTTRKPSWPCAKKDTILKRIKDDNLAADINRIAGPEFLENVRKRHEKYGAMVQSILIKSNELQVDLGAEVRALGSAIVAYATKVCAHVEEDDANSLAEARAALQPIDLHRDANAKKAAGSSESPAAEPPVTP